MIDLRTVPIAKFNLRREPPLRAILFVEDENEYTLRLALVYLHNGDLYVVEAMLDYRMFCLANFDMLSAERERMEKQMINAIHERYGDPSKKGGSE